MKLSKVKIPDTSVLIFSLIVVAAILTWFIPGGEYKKVNGEMIFNFIDSVPQGLGAILLAPIKGFIAAAEIIGFVLFIGGTFGVLQKTEAVTTGIRSLTLLHRKSKLARIFLIPVLFALFSLGGAVFGMAEETIPFVLIFIPLSLAMGYDSIVGVAIPFVGASTGFAAAFYNPFTIGVAQGIAKLQPFSGIGYRVIVWIVFTLIAITLLMLYCNKIKKNPKKSPTYEIDQKKKEKLDTSFEKETVNFDLRHKLVLIAFALSIATLIFGVKQYKWYIEEISALFFATAIVVGILGRLKIQEFVDSYMDGVKTLAVTAIIIGLARSILIVAKDGKIIDTILYYLSGLIKDFHPIITSQCMFVVQTIINFFVPSGSGQAALTMPIMAPLADLVNVTRQTAVLAYQFGDGFSNMIIPTSAVLMGILSLAEIPWSKWIRWIMPLQIIFFIAGCLMLIPPFFMNWQ